MSSFKFCCALCQRQHWQQREFDKRQPTITHCSWCGGGIQTDPGTPGRPRDYCDDTCKQAAARARKRRNPAGAIVTARYEAEAKQKRAAEAQAAYAAALAGYESKKQEITDGIQATASYDDAKASRELEALTQEWETFKDRLEFLRRRALDLKARADIAAENLAKVERQYGRRAETARLRRAARRDQADAERAKLDPEFAAWQARMAAQRRQAEDTHGDSNRAGQGNHGEGESAGQPA